MVCFLAGDSKFNVIDLKHWAKFFIVVVFIRVVLFYFYHEGLLTHSAFTELQPKRGKSKKWDFPT